MGTTGPTAIFTSKFKILTSADVDFIFDIYFCVQWLNPSELFADIVVEKE